MASSREPEGYVHERRDTSYSVVSGRARCRERSVTSPGEEAERSEEREAVELKGRAREGRVRGICTGAEGSAAERWRTKPVYLANCDG